MYGYSRGINEAYLGRDLLESLLKDSESLPTTEGSQGTFFREGRLPIDNTLRTHVRQTEKIAKYEAVA